MKLLAPIILFHGEALFRAGQPASQFYLVRHGRIIVLDQDGKIPQRNFEVNELFGVPEVLASGNWSLTAIADGPTNIQPFPAQTLFQSLAEMPDSHSDFLRGIAAMA